MSTIIIIAQLLLSLSILVVLHEMGHFLPSKWFGAKVEKFYLFFDAWGKKIFSFQRGETEYGIGWLPLGGYVKIAGMVDESMDIEQLKEEPKEWEFRSKPAWQRLIIMLGGVFVNFILGFFIFGLLFYIWGEKYLPAEQVTQGIAVDSIGYEMGLREGDQILRIGNKEFDVFSKAALIRGIVVDNVDKVQVRRDGQVVDVAIDPKFTKILSGYKYKNAVIFEPNVPFVIAGVGKGKPAEEAGFQKGDVMLGVNGTATPNSLRFRKAMVSLKGQSVNVSIERDQQPMEITVNTNESGKIGINPEGYDYYYEQAVNTFGFVEAMRKGVDEGIDFLAVQIKAFGQMFKGKINPVDSLGGFGTIASLFPSTWSWPAFWRITAILSLILGFMNLLPIPALDGGHVMFLLYEMVTGQKPSDKFLEYATVAGFIFLIALVLLVNGLDIYRWIVGS